MFGFSKFDIMFGRQQTADAWHPYRDIEKVTCDILVVALGADYDIGATPGLAEDGYEFYSVAGAERALDALDQFEDGAVVVGVLGPFFKCPGAPNEAALLVDAHLARRGLRAASTIHLVSPMPMPIPISKRTSDVRSGLLGRAAAIGGWAVHHGELELSGVGLLDIPLPAVAAGRL